MENIGEKPRMATTKQPTDYYLNQSLRLKSGRKRETKDGKKEKNSSKA